MASSTASDDPALTRPPDPAGRPPTCARRLLIATIVTLAAALAGYAAHRFARTEPVDPPVAVVPLEDSRELAARRRDAIGTYATGATPGEREIVVRDNGQVEFSEMGANPASGRSADAWQLARRGKKFCLATPASGIIDIINIDTIEYYGDTYRRTK